VNTEKYHYYQLVVGACSSGIDCEGQHARNCQFQGFILGIKERDLGFILGIKEREGGHTVTYRLEGLATCRIHGKMKSKPKVTFV
jgi:hypothetical protein